MAELDLGPIKEREEEWVASMYYKALGPGGVSCHGGSAKWSLPTADGPGEWMPEITGIVPCDRGYHVCTMEQLPVWLNAELYECECDGEHIDHGDKHVFGRARLTRRLIAWNERTARLYACDCAEHVLPLYEDAMPRDPRPRQAIEVARLYADGKATSAKLAAARGAAWDAARDAAWDAAGCAAWAAAGCAANGCAARDAARDAAGAAERAWQVNRLRAMLYAEAQ